MAAAKGGPWFQAGRIVPALPCEPGCWKAHAAAVAERVFGIRYESESVFCQHSTSWLRRCLTVAKFHCHQHTLAVRCSAAVAYLGTDDAPAPDLDRALAAMFDEETVAVRNMSTASDVEFKVSVLPGACGCGIAANGARCEAPILH